MLAYLFWHRVHSALDIEAYEDAQRSFHASIDVESASFRVEKLPFASGSGAGYEDWYLVDGWDALGELNRAAVDARRRAVHDRVASMAGDGWGALYALRHEPMAIPDGLCWVDKPRGESYEEFIASLPETTIWQRQMALGLAPEFCVATPAIETDARKRIWPTP